MQIRCETPGGRKKYIYAPARHDVHCIGLDMVALGCGFRAVGCRLLANLGSLSWRNPCSRFLPLTPAQDAQTSKPIGRRKTAGWVSGFHPAAAGSWPPSSESGNPVRSCGSGGRAASTVRRSAAVQVLVSKSKKETKSRLAGSWRGAQLVLYRGKVSSLIPQAIAKSKPDRRTALYPLLLACGHNDTTVSHHLPRQQHLDHWRSI